LGHEALSDKHVVDAFQQIQDDDLTSFVDKDGEVVAEWPTRIILKTDWEQLTVGNQAFWTALRAYRLEHYPRNWQRWTPEEESDLRKQYEEGMAVTEIAKVHERSVSAITARLLQMGKVHWT
jgi:DNA-directed RNA polymerase specialized sigma24 family protein